MEAVDPVYGVISLIGCECCNEGLFDMWLNYMHTHQREETAVTLQMNKPGIYFKVFKRLKNGVHTCSVVIPTWFSHENSTLPIETKPDF